MLLKGGFKTDTGSFMNYIELHYEADMNFKITTCFGNFGWPFAKKHVQIWKLARLQILLEWIFWKTLNMLCYNGGEMRNGLIILLRGLWWGWKNLILMFIHR